MRLFLPASFLVALVSTAVSAAVHPSAVILNLKKSPHAKVHNVPVSAVTINDDFWSARRRINVEKSIPTMLQLLESNGVVDNFRRLNGEKVERQGPVYTDSDIYKWIEAVAFVLQTDRRPDLESKVDALVKDILAAQEPSGYLDTYYQDENKNKRWTEMDRSHELYCLGHLLQAAIAYYRATGKRDLLDGGIRYVEYLLRDFGPDKHPLLSGHPEIEMALIELYRTTGERKYLDLAGYILHGDGERLKLRPSQLVYMFSGKPFTERTVLGGHAVRAGYACAGAADYYMETGDPTYKATLKHLWNDLVTTKMYITGGTGSRSAGEAFGDPYELPNAKAYTESCAAIANLMWNWRMLAATGESKYADTLELALYNSINSGMSLEGTLYCYRNPLELDEDSSKSIRNPWYRTTCCPPNLERTLASLPGYMYGTSPEGLYVHLYDDNELDWKLEDGTPLRVRQSTRYPWDGVIDLTLVPARATEFTVFLRIPSWSRSAQVTVGGKPVPGTPVRGQYFPIHRRWSSGETVRLSLDMTPREIVSHPRVMDNQGRAAIMRGPIVYILEQTDQPEDVPVLESFFKLTGDGTKDFAAEYRAHLLGGVVVLHHRGLAAAKHFSELPLYTPIRESLYKPERAVDFTLTPYYTFQNRGPVAMQVWTAYTK